MQARSEIMAWRRETRRRLKAFRGFQIDRALLALQGPMAEETEETKKKGGFFSKLMKIAFIAAIVGAVVVVFTAIATTLPPETPTRCW